MRGSENRGGYYQFGEPITGLLFYFSPVAPLSSPHVVHRGFILEHPTTDGKDPKTSAISPVVECTTLLAPCQGERNG